ncbi:adenylate/guanylate cyclase domain-containing protein [Taibaiella koreensis]|uniref:adenylate/guanylate cyclase domain-containing protein n=1 Tax=Taibaiella koreensis TaxID=1268548 RepID=UPI000E59ED62|nr:adenylate/guanylate cyclase domain-containing protein [Taibaiella koreensis]
MKPVLFFFLLLWCNSNAMARLPSDSADYYVTGDVFRGKAQSVALDKPWRFHASDSAQWAGAGYDDSHWALINTGFEEKGIKVLKQSGFKQSGWFRTTVHFDSAAIQKPLGIKITNSGAMSIYLDGVLLDTYGSFERDGKSVYENQEQPLLINIKSPGTYVLAIRYENKDIYKDQLIFINSGFQVGIASAEIAMWSARKTMYAISVMLLPTGSVFLALFAIHLLLFLFYREDRSNLYFALFNLGVGLMLILLFLLTDTVDVRLQERLSPVWVFSVLLAVFGLSTFINHLFGSFGWRYRIITLFCILSLFSFIFFLDNDIISYIPLALFLLVALEAIVLIIIAIVKKRPGARILGLGILFFFGSIIFIVVVAATTGGFSVKGDNTWALALMAVFLALFVFSIPLSISGYLAWKFSNTNKNLKDQVAAVERLSGEKQVILENQKEALELEVTARTQEVLQQKKQIEQEKKKSDDLLLNILPAEVAEELKENGATRARYFDHVSVLFTDFVNFTHIAELLSPEELVQELHECFRGFDEIIERNRMEKIKTIGDAYLAVSGMPSNDERHAYHAVKAGLEILDFVRSRSGGKAAFEVRVGINSGSLVAGIVGVKKFAYDIWGDTVNMASRMESNSEAGRVNISESTHELIKDDDFIFTYRGKINAKNKGEVDMYFVDTPNSPAAL